MKKIAAAITLISVFTGCHKNDDTVTKAVITGYDYRACACCGGLMMNFGDNTQQYDSGSYHVTQLPAGSNIVSTDSFPVKVYIQWQNDTTLSCDGTRRIIITKLVKR